FNWQIVFINITTTPPRPLPPPPSTPQIDALKLIATLRFCNNRDKEVHRSTYACHDEARQEALSFPTLAERRPMVVYDDGDVRW
ncbi:Hypothetical predicted protein, partial [Olea europaea subsp. europaea]